MVVGKDHTPVLEKFYGMKSLEPEKEPLTEATLFDAASVTKAVITALVSVILLENKSITLKDPVKKFFPQFPFDIQLIHLLTHTSGLPSWYPLFINGPDYISAYSSMDLEAKPGKKVNYSCLGYILLYFIYNKVTSMDFKDFVRTMIFEPLQLKNSYLSLPRSIKKKAAPTELGNEFEKGMVKRLYPGMEKDFKWRDYLIQGETHDCNSFYQGGAAGNSGLFSTPGDIYKLSFQFYAETTTLLKPESTSFFWKNYTPYKKSHRSIGFKLNSSFITSGGNAISRKAIGHNGFTGTSIWFDPQSGYRFILLTNRVHPSVTEIHFDKIRRKLHRLLTKVIEA